MVGRRIRERRLALGLTQSELGERLAREGVSVATSKASISNLEHGMGLDVDKFCALWPALECTGTWLLGATDDPESWEPDS